MGAPGEGRRREGAAPAPDSARQANALAQEASAVTGENAAKADIAETNAALLIRQAAAYQKGDFVHANQPLILQDTPAAGLR